MPVLTHTQERYSEQQTSHDYQGAESTDVHPDDDGLEVFLEEMIGLNDCYSSLGQLFREEE